MLNWNLGVFNIFWRENPNLLYGLAFLLGVSCAIDYTPFLAVPLLIVFFPLIFYKVSSRALIQRLIFAFLFVLTGFFYTWHFFFVNLEKDTVKGDGIFTINSIEKGKSYYGHQWIYKGYLREFYDSQDRKLVAKNVPCSIYLNVKKEEERPKATSDYILRGTLSKSDKNFSCILFSPNYWRSIEQTFSCAELRHQFKNSICTFIDHYTPLKRSATFLKGISTGEFSDQEMKFEFSRFGLQHIMAISGFHFAIVAAFFNLLIRFFFKRKSAAKILVMILCSYFLFLGPGPSVMRAWIMILIVVGGFLLERRGSGLNSLGTALMIILSIDPHMIKHMGFQFSFIVTASILLNFSNFDALIQSIFPKRPFSQIIEMDLLDQHGYCMVSFLRKALALTLAVNLVSLPLCLMHFHKFPLMALVYNWFFPFMVSFSMILLIIGSLFFFIPFWVSFFYSINSYYTDIMLNFAYNFPSNFDFFFRTKALTAHIVLVMISVIFLISILARAYLNELNREERLLRLL